MRGERRGEEPMQTPETTCSFSGSQPKQLVGVILTFPGKGSVLGGFFWGWILDQGNPQGEGT